MNLRERYLEFARHRRECVRGHVLMPGTVRSSQNRMSEFYERPHSMRSFLWVYSYLFCMFQMFYYIFYIQIKLAEKTCRCHLYILLSLGAYICISPMIISMKSTHGNVPLKHSVVSRDPRRPLFSGIPLYF